jgi:tetratricopeptide (TPR) repeat protein
MLIWTVVLIAYSNSFYAGMVFDNASVILQDPRIRDARSDNVGQIFRGEYWYNSSGSGLYRPLTTLSYLLNFAVLGDRFNPMGYHWINLCIHCLNTSIVYALGMLLLGRPRMVFAITLIWGIHPLLTESVTNIVGRADLLAALGVFGGLLCYIKAARERGRRACLWLVLTALAQAVGVFAKESALILPAVVLLYDMTSSGSVAWRTRPLHYTAFALPIAGYFYLRSGIQSHLTVDFADNPLVAADFWTAKLTALKVIGKISGLVIWPQHLSADYSYNAVPMFGRSSTPWENAMAIVALGACVGAIGLAVRCRRSYWVFSFFLGFCLLALVPTSNLFVLIGSIMGERFAYVPSMPLIGCIVIAFDGARSVWARRLYGGSAYVLGVAGCATCLAFAARTYSRNLDWRDDYSLWTSATAVCPENAKAHNNLGNALLRVPGQRVDANDGFEGGELVLPDYQGEYNDLGAAPRTQANLAGAIREYETALRINPNFVEAHFNLGNALIRQPDRSAEGIDELQAALRLRPNYPEAHNALGNALARLPGRTSDAVVEFQIAIGERPAYVAAHGNLGNALLHLPGRLDDAIREDRIVIALAPELAEAHYNLANALLISGRAPEAVSEYEAALKIRPEFAEAHYNLASALSRIPGRQGDSIAEYHTAIRLRPDLRFQGHRSRER